ncbi:uncharacterized protein LOC110931252 [Helianthus annuus]|uniref:uncharacterized protein LOC110931252 n=1 Tax=Helianthus annuus TaxID=4232 RepID=UPI000B8F2E8E|nr:uncharacterized protein LOC110931252 [Helianthus annuus]
MVTPLDKAIEKYIDGFPDPAIELAATLTDSQVKKGKLHRKGDKKQKQSNSTKENKGKKSESSKKSRKRKASKNFTVTAQANQAAPNQPAQPAAKRHYAGNAPLCNKCNIHHQPRVQCCICTNCGKSGHLANTCRFAPNQNQAAQNQTAQNPAQNPAQPHYPPGSCFNCGDLTHYRKNCPRLANTNQEQARGRAFNLNANEERADNEVVNVEKDVNWFN